MTHWDTISGETPIDPSGLKVSGITNRKELNELEFREIQKVTVKYLAAPPSRRIAPFDLDWLERLHGEMFGAIWDWAGRCRTIDLNLGVPWQHCEPSLQSMVDDLAVWQANAMELLERAVRLHHRAVSIHPFHNGNGRWARMLANIYLMQNDHPIVSWPIQTIGDESAVRAEYIRCLNTADEGDISTLLDLHRRMLWE